MEWFSVFISFVLITKYIFYHLLFYLLLQNVIIDPTRLPILDICRQKYNEGFFSLEFIMLDNRNIPERLLVFDKALTTANASDESLLGFLQAHMAGLLVDHFISISFHWKLKGKYLYEIHGGGGRSAAGMLVMGKWQCDRNQWRKDKEKEMEKIVFRHEDKEFNFLFVKVRQDIQDRKKGDITLAKVQVFHVS